YSLGRKSEATITAASAATPAVSSNATKGGTSTANPAQSMTFYKSVEQKDANPELTPSSDTKTDTNAAAASNSATSGAPALTSAANPNDSATLPTSGYFVQVAAVSKQDDAEALV